MILFSRLVVFSHSDQKKSQPTGTDGSLLDFNSRNFWSSASRWIKVAGPRRSEVLSCFRGRFSSLVGEILRFARAPKTREWFSAFRHCAVPACRQNLRSRGSGQRYTQHIFLFRGTGFFPENWRRRKNASLKCERVRIFTLLSKCLRNPLSCLSSISFFICCQSYIDKVSLPQLFWRVCFCLPKVRSIVNFPVIVIYVVFYVGLWYSVKTRKMMKKEKPMMSVTDIIQGHAQHWGRTLAGFGNPMSLGKFISLFFYKYVIIYEYRLLSHVLQ